MPLVLAVSAALAQSAPPGIKSAERSPLSTFFVAPTRVVWQSEAGAQNAGSLLKSHAGQAVLKEPQPPCVLTGKTNAPAGILLDFGRELHGYVELITPLTGEQAKMRRVRVRFGESVSEAMAELGGKQNAQNDHAVRDQVVTLPWLGKKIDRSDWLEIYNPGPAVLNLGGWFLTDDPANLAQWRFPGINLPANRYLLVWASQKDRANPAAPLHTNFKLAKDAGGYLALVNPATNVVSEYVAYPAQPRDVSYGRDRLDPDSLGFFITPTPGAQNSTSGAGFAPEPGFSLESGIYTNNSLTLTITVPPGTTVRYRLDGYEPANNSTAYTGPINRTLRIPDNHPCSVPLKP